MRLRLSSKTYRAWLAGALLLAFALRALVPQGFMPSSDRAFSIEICPEGFPAELLAHGSHQHHHHHGGTAPYTDHCVFGSACASGPPLAAALASHPLLQARVSAADRFAPVIVVRLVYLPESRGPPARL